MPVYVVRVPYVITWGVAVPGFVTSKYGPIVPVPKLGCPLTVTVPAIADFTPAAVTYPAPFVSWDTSVGTTGAFTRSAKAPVAATADSPRLIRATAAFGRSARLRAFCTAPKIRPSSPAATVPATVPTGAPPVPPEDVSTPPLSDSPVPTTTASGTPAPADARPSSCPAPTVSAGCTPASNVPTATPRVTPFWLTGNTSVAATLSAVGSCLIVGISTSPMNTFLLTPKCRCSAAARYPSAAPCHRPTPNHRPRQLQTVTGPVTTPIVTASAPPASRS